MTLPKSTEPDVSASHIKGYNAEKKSNAIGGYVTGIAVSGRIPGYAG